MSATTAPGARAHARDRTVFQFIAAPADTSSDGSSISAGSIMEWIDRAGYACAAGWSGSYCVTAYVGNVRHRHSIPAGSLIQLYARVIYTGTSSMHIVVTVSSSTPHSVSFTPAATCILVFVARDQDGDAISVPPWEPRSRADQKLAEAGRARIPERTEIRSRTLSQEYTADTDAPSSVMRFAVPPSAANWGGNAHGGTVMRWIDEAVVACGTAWLGPPATKAPTTIYSGGIHFLSPIRIGDIVEVDARLIHTSGHSMHISTRVTSSPAREPSSKTLTTQCLTIAAVRDAAGVAEPVRMWTPTRPEDVRLDGHARDLIELRGRIPPLSPSLSLED